MFNNKQTSLIERKTSRGTPLAAASKNGFVQSATGFATQARKTAAKTRSGNGALKYSTTDNAFVDEFGTAAIFKKPRTYDEVSKSMDLLWAKNPENAVKFAFYLRMITRQVQLPDGSKTEQVQRGQGLRHEGIYRMIWLAVNHQDAFWNNITLYLAVGSWKDVFTMLSYDLQYNAWKGRVLDWEKFGQLILAGLENPNTSNLVKKYLPQIKANSACKTVESQADNIIAKWVASLLFGGKVEDGNGSTYKKYRKIKTSGNAHEWQKLISQGKILDINFDSIHGRALAQLVSGKFLKNNNLEARYSKWIESKPVAKYTGYVYELLATIPTATTKYKEETIVKQFATLVETAKKGAKLDTSLIVVRDTSSSMGSPATGTKVTSYDVAKGMALFFSEMLPQGHFANSWIEFNSDAKFHTWTGKNVVEKWKNDRSSYVGSTNFQSVIQLFVKIKRSGVSESEFPTGILCISDGEFNPAQLNVTNVAQALSTLKSGGFSDTYVKNFVIALWNTRNNYYGTEGKAKFETFGDVKNVFYLSGMDGSIISMLTGQSGKTTVPTTAAELFEASMDQEVLNMVSI